MEQKIVTREELDTAEKSLQEAIEEATKFALESPYPDVSELYDFLYVE